LEGLTDCIVVNYTNQTVTTNTTVTGCIINVENVSVTNGAKLKFDATQYTEIKKDFTMTSGTILEVE
jgi:hypothetical protein